MHQGLPMNNRVCKSVVHCLNVISGNNALEPMLQYAVPLSFTDKGEPVNIL